MSTLIPLTPLQDAEFKGLALVGGHQALDFVNSIKYRGELKDGDRLNSMFDVVDWAVEAHLMTKGEWQNLRSNGACVPRTLLSKVLKFRESLREAISLARPVSVATAAFLEKEISKLRFEAKINRDTGVLGKEIPISDFEDVYLRLVWAASDFLSQRDQFVVKQCSGHDCDWLFVDRTKAKRRRWCDTRTCGNAARVRKFRAENK